MLKSSLFAILGLAFSTFAGAMAEDEARIQTALIPSVTIPEMVVSGFECRPFVNRYVARFPELDFTEEMAYCMQSDVSSHSTEAQAITASSRPACQGSAGWTVEDSGRWLSFCDMGE